jgi:hypothetical protein
VLRRAKASLSPAARQKNKLFRSSWVINLSLVSSATKWSPIFSVRSLLANQCLPTNPDFFTSHYKRGNFMATKKRAKKKSSSSKRSSSKRSSSSRSKASSKKTSSKKKSSKKKSSGRRYSPKAGKEVETEMKHMRSGKHPVKNRKQAIAIGLSKARQKGEKVPKKAA